MLAGDLLLFANKLKGCRKEKSKRFTRNKANKMFGGRPCELSIVELSTYRQVIQNYYHLLNAKPNATFSDIVKQ